MLLACFPAQFTIQLITVFAYEVLRVMDVDCAEITSHSLTDVGEVCEL